mgnify:CR=1 FL=1
MKKLFQGNWVSLVENEGYEYLSEPDLVFVFCKRIFNDGTVRFAIRSEYCPPYSTTKNFYTVISGTIEENETSKETAIRELEEEAGIRVLNEEEIVTAYENIQLFKATDAKVNLFYCTIDEDEQNLNYEIVDIKGDGTENEKKSQTIWLTFNELLNILKNSDDFDLLFLLSVFIYLEVDEF